MRVIDKERFSSVKVHDHSWVSDLKDDEQKWSVNDIVRQWLGLTNSVFLRLYETNQLLKLSIGAQCDWQSLWAQVNNNLNQWSKTTLESKSVGNDRKEESRRDWSKRRRNFYKNLRKKPDREARKPQQQTQSEETMTTEERNLRRCLALKVREWLIICLTLISLTARNCIRARKRRLLSLKATQ